MDTLAEFFEKSKCQTVRRTGQWGHVAAVKREIPVRAGEWDVSEPGWIEADTVAHCGGNMGGNFVWTLTMTDIQTQWTEMRMMWNRGAAGTLARVKQIEQVWPFAVRGIDCDNGGEFLNWPLRGYCKNAQPPILLTRSRPYTVSDCIQEREKTKGGPATVNREKHMVS